MESIYFSIFRIFSDMSLAALFWQKRKPPKNSQNQCILSRDSVKCAQGQLPSTMEDFFRPLKQDLSQNTWGHWNFDLRDTLQKVPKILSAVGENCFLKRPWSSLDPIVKNTLSIFALSFLSSAQNLISTTIAQDLLSPLGECISSTSAQSSWVLP